MNPLARAFSHLLRLPPQPGPPPGDEAAAMVFRASPKFLRCRTAVWAVCACLLLGAGSVPLIMALAMPFPKAGDAEALMLFGSGLLFFLALLLAALWLTIRIDYAWRWYVLTDRSLRVREGVWHVREITVTFANVQNLSVEQGPVQRLFGISDVKVDTAGGGGANARNSAHGQPGNSLHTARLRGLDNADEVKALIQKRLRGRRDAGLGDLDDDVPSAEAAAGVSPETIWAAAEFAAEAKALRAAAEALAARA